MQLLKYQKNEILELIKKNGLSPSKFIIDEEDKEQYIEAFLLDYIESDFYFEVKKYSSSTEITITPYNDQYSYFIEIQRYSWNAIWPLIKEWVSCLKRELETPDKWEEYYKLSKSLDEAAITWEEQDFTTEEKAIVNGKLNLLKENISKLDLMEEQIEKLNESIDRLSVKVDNLNKIDWRDIFTGTLFNKFFDLAIGSEVAKQILDIVILLFSNLPLLK